LSIGLPVLYFELFLWPLDCMYFILYFFFCHWIVCTLFCTFCSVIGFFYFMFYFFFSHSIVCTLFCTFSLVIGLSVLYFVLSRWSLDCLYFILYFFFSH
jgi:hypothetical protein